MSYVRCGHDSDVYLIGTLDNMIECCGCPFHPTRAASFIVASPTEMMQHLDDHREKGHQVPDRAYQRLRPEAVAYDLKQEGYVRKKAKWQLPRQLGLVRREPSEWRTLHAEQEPVYEEWVPFWCKRIANLPLPIEERRRLLHAVACDQRRRDALVAAFDVQRFNLRNRLIINIAEAVLDA